MVTLDSDVHGVQGEWDLLGFPPHLCDLVNMLLTAVLKSLQNWVSGAHVL